MGKTITEIMIENKVNERVNRLGAFLKNPAIKETNNGFEIDVIELTKQMSVEQKSDLLKVLLSPTPTQL